MLNHKIQLGRCEGAPMAHDVGGANSTAVGGLLGEQKLRRTGNPLQPESYRGATILAGERDPLGYLNVGISFIVTFLMDVHFKGVCAGARR